MGRKRIDHGNGGEARIALMMSAGHGAERIAAELGVSLATAKRRMKDLKGTVVAAKSQSRQARKAVRVPPPSPTPRPVVDDPLDLLGADGETVVIPDDSSLEQVDRWLKVAEREADASSMDDDPKHYIAWVRLATGLLEQRRKVAPLPKEDPNEHPDMVEAAVRVRKRFHALGENLMRVAKSPLAESIGKLLKGAA